MTTVLSAVLQYAPPDVRPRIYTHSEAAADLPDYFAVRARGIGIPFYREMKIYLPRVRTLLEQTRADGADLIHLTTPGPIGLTALYVASKLGVPLIGSFHTDLGSYARMLSGWHWLERCMREYLRWPYGRCERIFVPSRATGAMLVNERIDPARIAVWVRGVDTEKFSPAHRSQQHRKGWGLTPDDVALLYVGRLSREKGLALVPNIDARLRRAGIARRWIFVGDGPYRRHLERRLQRAIFMGTVPHRDVAVPMASADLFVFPSCTDTAGNVVLEAQACGLPVIVSDRGGPQENTRPGVSGRVCRGADSDDFARAIIGLARDRDRRRAMSIAARAYGLRRRWEDALVPLYGAYREVAARVRGPHGAAAAAWCGPRSRS